MKKMSGLRNAAANCGETEGGNSLLALFIIRPGNLGRPIREPGFLPRRHFLRILLPVALAVARLPERFQVHLQVQIRLRGAETSPVIVTLRVAKVLSANSLPGVRSLSEEVPYKRRIQVPIGKQEQVCF